MLRLVSKKRYAKKFLQICKKTLAVESFSGKAPETEYFQFEVKASVLQGYEEIVYAD